MSTKRRGAALAANAPLPPPNSQEGNTMQEHLWWRDAVIYQVYVRSFADSDGDGVGDLNGLRSRLGHIASLGVDGLWLSPCYPSPQRDHGYDIADYTDIEPAYGTLTDFQALIAEAHHLGLKVLLDMVANHCSSDHPWFRQALDSPAGSPARQRFLFRDGAGPDGAQPPNDWQSVFGGPAWTRVTDQSGRPGQWYLHLFDTSQPDFNWQDHEVAEMFDGVLRFWFDLGVDGFRLDVAHGLVKHPELADWPPKADGTLSYNRNMWNRAGVHEVYRRWRSLADSYPHRPMLIGEVWVPTAEELAEYLRPDELHQVFFFELLGQPWDATAYQTAITNGLRSCGPSPTWTMANHDVPRTVTRLGTTNTAAVDTGADLLAAVRTRGQVNLEVGDRRARAALLLLLALPGSVYLYQGEELGLPEFLDLPLAFRTDPISIRSGGKEPGRDGCRIPLPWDDSSPSFGFSPPGATTPPWLPQPSWSGGYAVSQQAQDPQSFLSLHRDALRWRRKLWADQTLPFHWMDIGRDDVVAFARGGLVCVTNFGSEPLPVSDAWGSPLLSSAIDADDNVTPESTAWFG